MKMKLFSLFQMCRTPRDVIKLISFTAMWYRLVEKTCAFFNYNDTAPITVICHGTCTAFGLLTTWWANGATSQPLNPKTSSLFNTTQIILQALEIPWRYILWRVHISTSYFNVCKKIYILKSGCSICLES